MSKREKPMTAAELMARLEKDREYCRRRQEQENQRMQAELVLREEQKPLLADLADCGVVARSVWDLVNSQRPYPEAVDVLLKHLAIPYHHRTREGIARALTVKEARGHGWKILQELRRSTRNEEGEFRFALVNALTVMGDTSNLEELEQMVSDPRLVELKMILGTAIESIAKRDRTSFRCKKPVNRMKT